MAYLKKRDTLPDGWTDLPDRRRMDVHMRGGVVGRIHKRGDRKYEARYRKVRYPRWPRVLGMIAALCLVSCNTPPVDVQADADTDLRADVAADLRAEMSALHTEITKDTKQTGTGNINIDGDLLATVVLAALVIFGVLLRWAWKREPGKAKAHDLSRQCLTCGADIYDRRGVIVQPFYARANGGGMVCPECYSRGALDEINNDSEKGN